MSTRAIENGIFAPLLLLNALLQKPSALFSWSCRFRSENMHCNGPVSFNCISMLLYLVYYTVNFISITIRDVVPRARMIRGISDEYDLENARFYKWMNGKRETRVNNFPRIAQETAKFVLFKFEQDALFHLLL